MKKTSLLGCDKAEVLHQLQEVFQYYVAYTQRYTPIQAYAKVVRRWPDAMFDAYTFPKVLDQVKVCLLANHWCCACHFQRGSNYVVRKASKTTLSDQVGTITGPSEVSDSEAEEEEEETTSETTTSTANTGEAKNNGTNQQEAQPEEGDGEAGQQETSDQPATIVPDGNEADEEVDYDDITNDAVTVGEDDDVSHARSQWFASSSLIFSHFRMRDRSRASTC